MKYWFILLLCLTAPNLLRAQKTLRGLVKSKETGQPVAAASVYLANTSTGVVSGGDGRFAISPFPEGRYDLVVSAVGYEIFSTLVNAAELPDDLVVQLVPKVKEMDEVIVRPFIKDGWKTWGKIFMDELIGKTPNAGDCKLLNKEVVRFRLNEKENYIEAIASEPLLIENEALGYTLSYDLVLFRVWLSKGYCLYQGYPLFKDRETDSERKRQRWQRNRREAYEGSVMHFMRSLYRNELLQEGFEVRRVLRLRQQNEQGYWRNLPPVLLQPLLSGDSIARSLDSATVQLQFDYHLQVLYRGKKNPRPYIRYLENSLQSRDNVPISAFGQPSRPQPNQPVVSEIFAVTVEEGIQVLYNGHYYFSTNLIAMQFWAWSEKLCNLLPLDYGNPLPVNARTVYQPR
jgi:hypothetical protein